MKSSTGIAQKPGGNSPTSMSPLSRLCSQLTPSSVGWKWFTGLIRRWSSPKPSIAPSRHFAYRSGTASRSASTTQDEGIKADFPELDKAAARVVVKHLVATGARKAAPNLLILPAHALTDWYDKEAVKYLQEQKAARQSQFKPKETEHGREPQ